MGLPMWKDPDEGIAEDAAAKLDRVAARRRSTIRRETTVRPARDSSSSPGLTNIIRSRHQNMLRTRLRLQQEQLEADAHIVRLEAELEQLRGIRLHNRARWEIESELARAGRDEAQSEDTAAPSELRLVSDENNNGGADLIVESTDVSLRLPRPSRESNLRFEVIPTSSTQPASPRRPSVYIPSPPRSAGDGSRSRAVPDGPVEPWTTTGVVAAPEALSSTQEPTTEVEREPLLAPGDGDRQGLETPPPESWEGSYPPLRRVGHMSPHPLPPVDSLGNWDSSPAPFLGVEEEEATWPHFLATIESGRSSTATSFASMRDSTVRSGRSSQNTSTSFGEIGSADDTCDLDLPPGITEDDVREMRARHRRANPDDIDGPMTGEQGLRAHRERVARRVELGMFQAILERMQRREDVPEDWWTMVGLQPADFDRANA